MWKVNHIDAVKLKKKIKPSGIAFLHSRNGFMFLTDVSITMFRRNQHDLFATTCNTK